jgi:hypothetical protein
MNQNASQKRPRVKEELIDRPVTRQRVSFSLLLIVLVQMYIIYKIKQIAMRVLMFDFLLFFHRWKTHRIPINNMRIVILPYNNNL